MRAPGERGRATPLPHLIVGLAALLGVACANVHDHDDTGAAGANPSGGASANDAAADASADGGGAGAVGIAPPTRCGGTCDDFPAAPLLDPAVTPDAPAMFAGVATGPAPCITEPEDGALFPSNWLRPRVKVTPAAPGTLREIRFHSDEERHDLVAYTLADAWTMPRAIWTALAANVRDEPIRVTVRELGAGAATVTFTIAPVPAPGSIVFWAAAPADRGATSSTLQGFAPGDETTSATLGVRDVQMQTRGADNGLRDVTCIGCHGATPDGQSVAFVDDAPWSMAIAGVAQGRTGLVPPYVTSGGTDAIRQPGLGIFSFSRSHWRTGDRVIVAPYSLDQACGHYSPAKSDARLAWLDLEAPPVDGGCPVEGAHFGFLARNGDPRGAANPTWSHDGRTIVYSSTSAGQDGRLATGPSDLFTVPYNAGPNGKGLGGDAAPLPGAADPAFEEYYPAFSPDDALVVFDRVPAGDTMYANPRAELFVVRAAGVPAAGGSTEAERLAANDPPACTGLASPGVNNHWAKWAPSPESVIGSSKTYYWLVFSSNRYGTPPVTATDKSLVQVSQLYATAVVVDAATAALTTYPAVYLWNQNVATLNTTPAWDPFKLPVGP